MNDETARWQATEAIFHDALVVAEPERTALLTTRCAGDRTLMEELRSLLAACEAEEAHRRSVGTEGVSPGASIGPYVIDGLIGRGGMGAVYRAHRADGQFEQQVAIKIVDMPLVSDFFRQRFRAERQMLADLAHPYIARLLDGGVSEADELYLVMEFIDGDAITRFCTKNSLPVEERLRLFMQVCEAVQYAHRNLIVHRDLKPENILVAEDGTPRLLDFGTATMVQAPSTDAVGNATRSELRTFTPRYASPEQVLGQSISIASDIYSLGVLLYVLLTDQDPYDLANFSTEELLRVICGVQPRRPSGTPCPFGRIDADLDSILLKAMRKDPKERYSTAESLATDIQAYLDHRPVEARKGNFRYLAGKFVRRNWLALAGGALLLATVAAGAAGVTWQAHVANQQRRKADARSTELRQLSTSLLAEIDATVKDMPGSTPVRRMLVTRVLEHLDQLANEAGDDPVLALDMVNAYTRLGNLEGNPYGPNLGDTTGALKSLDRAVSFARALHVATTKDAPALLAFGFAEQSRSEVLYALGRDAESVVALQAGLRSFDALAALPNATVDEVAGTAAAYNALGDQRSRAGRDDPNDPESSVAAYRHDLFLLDRVLKASPNHSRARRGAALMYAKMGYASIAVDPMGAVAALRQSIVSWEALPPELRSLTINRQGEAFAYLMLGEALTEARDYRGALEAYDQALHRLQPMAAADPKDTSAVFWVADDLLGQGLVYEQMLDPALYSARQEDSLHRKLGLEALRRSVGLFDQLVATDPHNPTWISRQGQARVALGTMQFGTSQAAQGARMAASALNTLRTASDGPNVPLLLLAPAVRASLSVKPERLRDPSWTLKAAQRLNERTGYKTPSYLLDLAEAYRASGDTYHASQCATEGLALHAPTPPGAPVSRSRTLLALELTRSEAALKMRGSKP